MSEITLHKTQQEVSDYKAKIKIVGVGVGWGKTTLVVNEILKKIGQFELQEGKHTILVIYSGKQLRQMYRYCVSCLNAEKVVSFINNDYIEISNTMIKFMKSDSIYQEIKNIPNEKHDQYTEIAKLSPDYVIIEDAQNVEHFANMFIYIMKYVRDNEEQMLITFTKNRELDNGLLPLFYIGYFDMLGKNNSYIKSFKYSSFENPDMQKKGNEIKRGITYKDWLKKRINSLLYEQMWLAEFISEEDFILPTAEDFINKKINEKNFMESYIKLMI